MTSKIVSEIMKLYKKYSRSLIYMFFSKKYSSECKIAISTAVGRL